MSRVTQVLQVLKKYDEGITGGTIRVTGNQIQYRGNDGSLFYIDFDRQIIDLLRGGSSAVTIRT